MNITVSEELKAYIDPLTPDEYEALERSLLKEGCRDALVLWGDLLVDGHNRYAICQKHGLPFQTVQSQLFQSLEDVHLWMIDQHLGRRSVSDFQRGVLALRKREILAERRARYLENGATQATTDAPTDGDHAATGEEGVAPWEDGAGAAVTSSGDVAPAPALKSRQDIAKVARLSSAQVQMIEKIQKQATPEVVQAIKSGDLSLNAAAAVASLPQDEQRAAAIAGKEELKQAAKRAREAKRKPRVAPDAAGEAQQTPSPDASTDAASRVLELERRVAELTRENEGLRQQVAQLLQQLVK